MGWEVVPGRPETCSCAWPRLRARRIYVTENGAAYADAAATTAASPTERRSYLVEHTSCALARAIGAGVPLARVLRLVAARQLRVGLGLLEALRHRLCRLRDAGRIPKGSFYWYRDLIAAQREQAGGSEAAA